MKKIAIASLFVLLLMGFNTGGAQALNITTYYDSYSWLGAVEPPPVVTENFNDNIYEPGFSITEVNGAGSIIAGGLYQNYVDAETTRYQVFNYAYGMKGWGSYINTVIPGGPGSSIDVYLVDSNNVDHFVFNISNQANNAFFGFSTDEIFYGVKFAEKAGSPTSIETYYSIDMSIARVPEPATLLLLGLGLFGVGIASRKKS